MLTLGAAARKTGRSKSSISRAISSGRLPAIRANGARGGWLIDPQALDALYPLNGTPTIGAPVAAAVARSGELVALERLLAERETTIADLRSRLDRSEARLTRLLDLPWWRRLLRL